MSAALQIWSHTFCKAFDALPKAVQETDQRKIDLIGTQFQSYPHHRLTGRPEFRARVGDYRVLYEFSVAEGGLVLHFLDHRREVYKK